MTVVFRITLLPHNTSAQCRFVYHRHYPVTVGEIPGFPTKLARPSVPVGDLALDFVFGLAPPTAGSRTLVEENDEAPE